MLDTKMNAVKFAKKLRARRVQLSKARTKALAAHSVEFDAWKKRLATWIERDCVARVKSIRIGEVTGYRYGRNYTGKLFDGHPEPPGYPSDKPIKAIDSLLRRLSITGQSTVTVSDSDIAEIFGDDDGEE